MRPALDVLDHEVTDDGFDRALRLARADYRDMPGLRLTVDQACRLWALDEHVCDAVLRTLVDVRFLRRCETPVPSYIRA